MIKLQGEREVEEMRISIRKSPRTDAQTKIKKVLKPY